MEKDLKSLIVEVTELKSDMRNLIYTMGKIEKRLGDREIADAAQAVEIARHGVIHDLMIKKGGVWGAVGAAIAYYLSQIL